MRVFLIAGKGHHGKNTVAEYIKEYYKEKDEKTVITSYAKYIKLFAGEMTGWNGSEENKPREILQKIGEKIRDDIREDFFTRRMLEDIEFYKFYYDNIVIADARLPFEIEHIKEIHFETYAIRVTRDNYDNKLPDKEKYHNTEIALDNYEDFDYVVKNDGSLDDLKKRVFEILEGIE